jgi:thioesterase domain-containing protein
MTSAAQPGFEPNRMELLIGAWKSVFRRTSIDVNENFFKLGGDSSLATALFAEISSALGREISPVLVLHAPTIASLHAVLQSPGPFALPAITPLKEGGSKFPPILMFHGCGGTVLDLTGLAGSIQASSSIYGFQNPGIDGLAKPLDQIEQIAEYHFEAIKRQKIEGPYLLIGYSAGGLVALEIANRLKQISEKIALLVMIDSFLPLSALPAHRVLSVKLRREAHRWRASVSRSSRTSKQSERQADKSADGQPVAREFMRRYDEAERRALESYRGHSYDGLVRFIRAQASWAFPLNPRKVWSFFMPNMTVETTRGDHRGLITTNCSELATLVTRYIDEAL